MELRHLRAFVAVAELRSFRRAAEQLHLSQPPLSRQVQALEEELGARLLERGSRREVALTEAGRLFLADAKRVLGVLDAARRRVQEQSQRAQNRLVIANYSELSARVLPDWLKAFQSRFPHVEVSIREMNGADGFAALRSGRAQLGLVADHGLRVDPCFETEAVLSVPLLAVLPAGHALAKRRGGQIGLEALAQETVLYKRLEHAPCHTQRLPDLLGCAGVVPRGLQAVDGVGNLLAMTAAGYGVAVLPDIFDGTLRPTLRSKRLRLPEAVPPLELHTVWLRDSTSTALAQFLTMIRGLSTPDAAGVDGGTTPEPATRRKPPVMVPAGPRP